MLREFPESFSVFIPREDGDLDNFEKAADIDGERLNKLEKKIMAVWNNKGLPTQQKYEQVYLIFFEEFCKKLKAGDFKDPADRGQWIQAILERMSIFEIPINLLFRETATFPVDRSLEEVKEHFNREIVGREKGATSVKNYVSGSVRDFPNRRLLSHSLLDKKYKLDLLEFEYLNVDSLENQEGGEICLTQVKTETLKEGEVEEIYRKHQEYLKLFLAAQKRLEERKQELVQNSQESKENANQIIANPLDMQCNLVNFIEEEKRFKNGDSKNFENDMTKFAKKYGYPDVDLIWYVLKQIYISCGLNEHLAEFDEILIYAGGREIRDGLYAENLDYFDRDILKIDLSKDVYSKVILYNKVVSMKRLSIT